MIRLELIGRSACASLIVAACLLPGTRATADVWSRGAWVMSPGSFRLEDVSFGVSALAGLRLRVDMLQPSAPVPWPLLEAYRELSTGTMPQRKPLAWSIAAARRGIIGTLKFRF
jgi:hypothetical protein